MSYSLHLKLPDEFRQSLLQVAAMAGQTPEEWAAGVLRQRLARQDDGLRRHLGADNLGKPTGANNTQIDADLTRAYADTHQDAECS